MPELKTTGQVAEHLGEPIYRVEYVIKTRKIKPAGRAARFRLFDANGVQQIRQALDQMHQPEPATPR